MSISTEPVSVRVPATSANLGPGFDSLGLALEMYDSVTARNVGRGIHVSVFGEGAEELPTDERHLIADVMLQTFDLLGEKPKGLELTCVNTIPQARGLGSSSAAVVAGILLARRLTLGGLNLLTQSDVIQLATKREGHPDNIAPCILGGITIAWATNTEEATYIRAVKLERVNRIAPVIYVPLYRGYTGHARGILPTYVPYRDATFNVAHTAVLIYALTSRADLLFDATDDRLHQTYRAPDMPETAALVERLRGKGFAAMVSGAGPSVLALVPDDRRKIDDARRQCPGGWHTTVPRIDFNGAQVFTGANADALRPTKGLS